MASTPSQTLTDGEHDEASEGNRRALLSHYRTRSMVYISLSVALAIAFAVELSILGSSAFPRFLVYPLMIATVAPALFMLYSAIFWWRVAGYVVSVPIPPVEGDSLVNLNQRYLNLAHEGSPTFLLPGGRVVDARVIAIGILVVFVLSLPVSYFVSSLHAGLLIGTVAAVLFLGLIALAILLLYLISRREGVVRAKQIEAGIAALRDRADHFALGPGQPDQQDGTDQRIHILMHDLTTRMVDQLNEVGALRPWLTLAQKEELGSAVASITASMITMNLSSQAERIQAAYRAAVPQGAR